MCKIAVTKRDHGEDKMRTDMYAFSMGSATVVSEQHKLTEGIVISHVHTISMMSLEGF